VPPILPAHLVGRAGGLAEPTVTHCLDQAVEDVAAAITNHCLLRPRLPLWRMFLLRTSKSCRSLRCNRFFSSLERKGSISCYPCPLGLRKVFTPTIG
jgi:hypothetical protein